MSTLINAIAFCACAVVAIPCLACSPVVTAALVGGIAMMMVVS
jgi:hypothetical protein